MKMELAKKRKKIVAVRFFKMSLFRLSITVVPLIGGAVPSSGLVENTY